MANITLPPDEDELHAPGSRPGNPTQGWVQTDRDSHKAMWQLGVKQPSALAVLHFLVSKLNRGASGVVISAAALSRQMGISQRTAQSAVAALQKARFVQILKTGNANAYIVNSRVAWSGRRGQRYASFNAHLIVDEQEQTRTVEELLDETGQMIDVPIMEMFGGEDDPPIEIEALEQKVPEEKTAKSKPKLESWRKADDEEPAKPKPKLESW